MKLINVRFILYFGDIYSNINSYESAGGVCVPNKWLIKWFLQEHVTEVLYTNDRYIIKSLKAILCDFHVLISAQTENNFYIGTFLV